MARNSASAESRPSPARTGSVLGKLLPSDARIHHRSLILQHLFDDGPFSRADLARMTGLARVTVSDVVNDLLEAELVVELGVRPGTHMGKPATLIGVNVAGGYVVCLDLSDDTVLRGALVDLMGNYVTKDQVGLDGATGQDALDKTIALALGLIKVAPGKVLGVGIGTPGVVDLDGVVRHAPNLGWTKLDLHSLVQNAVGYHTYVANDADTAALAEDTFGEGSGSGLLLVKIGHGVGAGILIDGALLRGPDGTAGEIGHLNVLVDGPVCSCGRSGCLEALISVPHLRARIKDLTDAEASGVLTDAGRELGRILAPITQALGVRDVVLSGPDELLNGPFLQTAESTVLALTRPFVDDQVQLRMSALGHDGILAGAAAHVLGRELGLS